MPHVSYELVCTGMSGHTEVPTEYIYIHIYIYNIYCARIYLCACALMRAGRHREDWPHRRADAPTPTPGRRPPARPPPCSRDRPLQAARPGQDSERDSDLRMKWEEEGGEGTRRAGGNGGTGVLAGGD